MTAAMDQLAKTSSSNGGARKGARVGALALVEPPGKPRRRESKKADKLRRIRASAYALFSAQGYEATTLRQIARRAKVALGTLSLYADDKNDLVVLVFNEKAGGITDRAAKAAHARAPLLDKLVAFFGVFLEDIAKNITLARTHHQLNFFSNGRHAAEYNAHRARVFALIEEMVRDAKARGQIKTRDDPALIARHVFFCYSAAARWWVASSKPDLQQGIDDLRRLFRLQINGLSPR
jgi:AcrR family transcriptional regulator